MSTVSCTEFRALLARALGGSRVDPAMRATLSWHEHLLGCAACRDLLAAEEALEELLTTLPEPHLPAGLTRRVLARLAAERAGDGSEREPARAPALARVRLDRLLDLAPEPVAPEGLAARVLAGVAGRRGPEADLDDLLGRVPPPRAPRGLAQRVLAALEGERAAPVHAGRFGGARGLPWTASAAALALVALGAWRIFARPTAPEPARVASLEPEVELLECLDVLENWDLLMSPDAELWFADLEPADEILLELAGDVPSPAPRPEGLPR